jgi:glycosyltransferase involved in cell wall biosynthesis
MRITHLINRFLPCIGGSELYVYNLSRKLIELGNSVTVITTTSTRFRGIENNELCEKEIINGIKVVRVKAFLSGPGFILAPTLAKMILNSNSDVYNIHGFLSNISIEGASMIRSFKRRPIILTTHDVTIAENLKRYYPLWKLYVHSLGKFLCRNVDAIIVQNPQDASFIRSLEISSSKIYVVPNGIDTHIFSKSNVSKQEQESFKEKFKIKDDKFVLLFVGRIEKRKRIDLLLFTLKLITKEMSDQVLLLVIGPDQGEKAELLKLAKQLGLEKNVVFTGPLDTRDLLAAYAVADIFISLSAQEAFGLSVIEAMSMEVPVVTHRWKGISYIIKDGINGFSVDPFDVKALAEKTVFLLKNDEYRRSLGKMSRSYVVENFSIERMVSEILNVYKSIIK